MREKKKFWKNTASVLSYLHDCDDAFDKNWPTQESLDCISVVDLTYIQTYCLCLLCLALGYQFHDMLGNKRNQCSCTLLGRFESIRSYKCFSKLGTIFL